MLTVKPMVLLCSLGITYCIEILDRTRERCPRNLQERQSRAEKLRCLHVVKYHCLSDTYGNLVEACFDYKQLPKGYYPYHNSYATGNPIDYEECPDERFQTWPAKSYEISECTSLKSTCSSEGQIVCSPGTTTTDTTCRCDHTKGYAMKNIECCSPSDSADCTCLRKKCDPGLKLNNEYDCVHILVISENGGNQTSFGYSTTSLGQIIEQENTSEYNTKIFITFIVLGLFAFFCFSGVSIYVYRSRLYKEDRIKLTVLLIIFIVVIGGCCVLTAILDEKRIFGLIFFTVIDAVAIIGCSFVIVLVFSHNFRRERTVYNEEYQVEVFRLLDAAAKGDKETLMSIRDEEFIDMNAVDYDQRSALHLALCECQYEAVQYILQNGFCNLETTDRWNNTALDDWKRTKEEKKLKEEADKIDELLNSPTTDRKMDSFRETKATEIIQAAKNGELSVLKRFRRQGADMNISNLAGRTALHAAAGNGITKIVDYLLECRVSPFVRWGQKRPIECVPEDGKKVHLEIKQKLEKYMKNTRDKLDVQNQDSQKLPEDDVMTVRLLNCASRGDIQRMRAFRKHGYKMRICDYDKRTALHVAVSDNQEHIVEFLLEEEELQGDAIETKDRWGVTPLMASKELESLEIYYTILNHRPDILDTETDEHRTFLLLTAGANGDLSRLKDLYKKKVDMNLQDYDGRTALHAAAANGHYEVVNYLVKEAKVTVSIADRENRFAIDETEDENIRNILEGEKSGDETKYQLKKISSTQKTMMLIMNAASKGNLHKLDDVKYKRFIMDTTDYFKNTPLHLAADNDRLKDVKFLLCDRKVSPFVRNSVRKTPLDLVDEKITFWKQKEKITYGIESSCKRSRQKDFSKVRHELQKAIKDAIQDDASEEDSNFTKYDEKERLFSFLNKAQKGDIRAIKRYLLTDNETLLDKKDDNKRTALHIAAAEGHCHLVEYLIKQGVTVDVKDRWGVTPLQEARRIQDKEMIKILQNKTEDRNEMPESSTS